MFDSRWTTEAAMKGAIDAKELRASLPSVVKRVRGGERITVICSRDGGSAAEHDAVLYRR